MQPTQRRLANAIRVLAMDAVEAANSGHPGMPMGMADAATALFTRYLKFDPKDPRWPDRDRFILSAGHGSMLIYALLYLTGYERPTIDDIRNFRQLGSPCAGQVHALLAGKQALPRGVVSALVGQCLSHAPRLGLHLQLRVAIALLVTAGLDAQGREWVEVWGIDA